MFANDERSLLERAASWPGQRECSELTADLLRDIAARHGIDFATAVAYERLRRSRQHGEFIQGMDERAESERIKVEGRRKEEKNQRPAAGWKPAPQPANPAADSSSMLPPSFVVAVVPGAFFMEYPQTGANGAKVLDLAHCCGTRAERVPVLSFGSLKENARILRAWLREHAADDIVLVSLSKGGADVKLALAEPDAEHVFAPVRAWINVSGILDGTPLADWLLARRLPSLAARLVCWWHGQRFDVVRELTRGTESGCEVSRLLAGPLTIPKHMRVVHLVGFPLLHHLSGPQARRAHRRLQPLGPSDGGGILLADVMRWPGRIYPVWGADHYMSSPGRDVVNLVRRLLVSLVDDCTKTRSWGRLPACLGQ